MRNRMTRGAPASIRTLYATASAAAITLVIAGPVSAQTTAPAPKADDDTVEAVVVTGIRASIQNSINIKKNETSIVEAVSAEDIGKLPDVSIAESIARLPGLAAQRVNGRAQVISIRGLAPDFTTTLLNGRQQASSGDNRAVEFDQYPSELLSSVVIYKTPDAQVSGMGLSGTADLRTVRPLEYGKRALAVNLRGEKTSGKKLNEDSRNTGGRFSVSYINQFADDTIGVALGYAHLDSPSQVKHYKAYGYEAFPPESTSPDSADGALMLNGQEIFATSRNNKRDAVIGIFEYKPNDRIHSTLDMYYSTFKQKETTRGAQWFSNPYADNATFSGVTTDTIGGSKFASGGTLNNGVLQLRNDYNTRQDQLFSAGLNNEFQITESTRLVADLSYSSNKRKEQIMETYAGYGRGVGGVTGSTPDVGRTYDTIGFKVADDGFSQYHEGLNYADASKVTLGDRAPWGGWGHDGAIRFPHVKEDVTAVDVRLEHDLDGFVTQVSGGVNYTKRDKGKTVSDNDLFLKNGRQQVYVDAADLTSPTNLGFAGFGNVLSVKIGDVWKKYYNASPILDANYYDKNWDITEEVTTFFAKANFQSGALRGNVGVQVVKQKQESSGVVINGLAPGQPIVPTKINAKEDYTDVLPSMNLIYDLGGGHRIRFALSKTMARPRMDDMRANVTPGFNSLVCSSQPCGPGTTVNPWSASGGNPHLKPWMAKAADLAYEWYVSPATYLSVAGFYKKLDTYIYQQSGTFDFTGIPLPPGANIPAGTTINNIGQITLPANGNGGVVKGLEFSGALDFGQFADVVKGFGVQGSLSLTKSNLNPTTSTDPKQKVRIPGLSGTVYNLTGYYERGGFQARISQRYRSAFKGEVVQLFATRGFTEILADKQVDAQIGYTFQDGPLENLGLLLQVNNLTDSPYRTRLGLDDGGTKTSNGGSLPETYEKYGRQILFGVNYRF
ncbi:TonB-dependent receptor [Caulobacter vibrioides]|jgi:iron complex outermembrane receptor protein|uniref:TonB-dependent receptor n=1 Tax=Caulobacter vibrioides OR37 TaxID=1292034 RepID=R0ESM4_CAUVI|nr:TonB-dependent receptor [Caulobacter vibrioides]ENZ83982.1 TonB-dependent receptor [Caulobacter vibrioides OR37]